MNYKTNMMEEILIRERIFRLAVTRTREILSAEVVHPVTALVVKAPGVLSINMNWQEHLYNLFLYEKHVILKVLSEAVCCESLQESSKQLLQKVLRLFLKGRCWVSINSPSIDVKMHTVYVKLDFFKLRHSSAIAAITQMLRCSNYVVKQKKSSVLEQMQRKVSFRQSKENLITSLRERWHRLDAKKRHTTVIEQLQQKQSFQRASLVVESMVLPVISKYQRRASFIVANEKVERAMKETKSGVREKRRTVVAELDKYIRYHNVSILLDDIFTAPVSSQEMRRRKSSVVQELNTFKPLEEKESCLGYYLLF